MIRVRTVQVRMHDEDWARLDKLVAAWQTLYDRQRQSAHPVRVTRSSALRDLLFAWERESETPPVPRGFWEAEQEP